MGGFVRFESEFGDSKLVQRLDAENIGSVVDGKVNVDTDGDGIGLGITFALPALYITIILTGETTYLPAWTFTLTVWNFILTL
ncbi:hypothetical protein Tco_1499736 [Tanacetum coccineum]